MKQLDYSNCVAKRAKPQDDMILASEFIFQYKPFSLKSVMSFRTYGVNLILEYSLCRYIGVNCVELMPCHELNELEYSTSSKYVYFSSPKHRHGKTQRVPNLDSCTT